MPQTYTGWHIVFYPEDAKIIYMAASHEEEKIIDLAQINFDYLTTRLFLDVNSKLEGDITPQFHPYQVQENQEIIDKSFEPLTKEMRTELAGYPTTFDY